MRRAALALPLLAAATSALACWSPAAADASTTGAGSVLLVFLPSPPASPARGGGPGASTGAFEARLAGIGGLSVGIMSATQGRYTTAQFLLDITQGARVASSAYPTATPPGLSLRQAGDGAVVEGWQAARTRAGEAPQLLQPGLLAAQIPGGGAYAGITGLDDLDGVAAADRGGRVAAFSLGTAQTLLGRVAALRRSRRFVVADLPAGADGLEDLRVLSTGRTASELLIVLERTPNAPGHELLWSAVGGLAGGAGKELSSATTNQRGLIAAIDIAPTVLRHLGLTIPADVRGAPIHTDGRLRSASLTGLLARLRVIGGRRLEALGFLLCAWALLLLMSAPWPRARAWAMRTGGLGVLWAPVAVLVPAALEPSAPVEFATLALACLGLGALTDLLVPWPRAPLAPAVTAVALLVADALAGTQLLMRSLLGPDPILGARFYGIGNELKSGLAVLVLAAVAAALYPVAAQGPAQTGQRRRAAIAMAGTGVLLAAVEGSARLGAGVGGVILVSAGFAVATVLLLPGAINRRRALIVLVAPVLGLVALALLDLATAHGAGHYTGSILHARSAGDLRDVIVRRYRAAWDELHNHAMPFATVLALLAAALGVRRQERLLTPVANDAAWRAALAGGLAAGVVGALVEDSGPVLLVVAVFALGCVLSYLWGRPAECPSQAPARTPRRTRARRSRARTLSAGPAR
ncbi:MAG TPA: hypothetical protein VKG38_00550 [Solirubrobacteraceae bacterium]|nr:hypothetical protein [Solirubrobacteraceae bacterium]